MDGMEPYVGFFYFSGGRKLVHWLKIGLCTITFGESLNNLKWVVNFARNGV